MMHRRILLLVEVLVALVAVGFVVAGLNKPAHRISEASFAKIQEGMTEKEVEEILGGPYGQYFRGTSRVVFPMRRLIVETAKLDDETLCSTMFSDTGNLLFQQKGWIGESLAIWLWFDEKGLVTKKWSVRSN